MRRIVELILRVADLVEAEGRIARDNAFELAAAILLLAAAAALLVVGLVTAGWALGLGLCEIMHPAWAAAIVAVTFLLGALGVATLARRSLRDRWLTR